jgi:hypothetical protein
MSQSAPAAAPDADEVPRPWYTYKILWLVIGGPAAVVVASLVSAYVAIVGQDPVLLKDEVVESQRGKTEPDSNTPAMQARNHAATPER